jgi:hypothetical protein
MFPTTKFHLKAKELRKLSLSSSLIAFIWFIRRFEIRYNAGLIVHRKTRKEKPNRSEPP